MCILNILGAAILIRFAIEMSQCELLLLIMRIFPAVVSCLLNPNLLSFALVISHFSFSPPAYCPGNLVFYTSRFIEDLFDCCIPKSLCQNSLICLLLRCHVAFCSGTFHISAAMERIIKNGYAIAPVTNRISFEFTRIASTFTILKYCIQII